MTYNALEQFYRVWYEYLIRTPFFIELKEREQSELSGKQNPPLSEELLDFLRYGGWWGNWWLYELTFERCWTRLKIMLRQREYAGKEDTLEEFIVWSQMGALDFALEDNPNMSWEEKKAVLLASFHEATRGWNDKEQWVKSGQYIKKATGKNFPGLRTMNYLKNLAYYQLHEIEGLSYKDIFFGRFSISSLPYPVEEGPYIGGQGTEVEIWGNYKNNLRTSVYEECDDQYLKDAIKEARKTIDAVQNGWFPDFPEANKSPT